MYCRCKGYEEEVTCDVCGGKGVAAPRDAASRWLGGKLRHTDPQVCADNLRKERKRLERLANVGSNNE